MSEIRVEYGNGLFSCRRAEDPDRWTVEDRHGGLHMASGIESAMLDRIRDLEARVAASEAGAAAMREALHETLRVYEDVREKTRLSQPEWKRMLPELGWAGPIGRVRAALASDAGRELLERLEKAEARLRTAIATGVVTGVVEVDSDETQRLRESLCHARAQALEDAAKVAEVKGPCTHGCSRAQCDCVDRIAAAIRALKEGT